MTLQSLIVMIASAINDRLQLKLKEEERRILREQLEVATGGKNLSFPADQRRRLAAAAKLLTPYERRTCCHLVKPAATIAWYRQLAASKYDSSDTRPGRPPKTKDVRKLVIKLATDNVHWGYTRIRDALLTGLGIDGRTPSLTSWPRLASSLHRNGRSPAPGSSS